MTPYPPPPIRPSAYTANNIFWVKIMKLFAQSLLTNSLYV